jgi:hypothetical protein
MPDNDRASTFSFTDPNWRPFSKENLDTLHVTPNELWFNSSTKSGALVVRQSGQYAEYALSKIGLDHLHDAVRAGKVTTGNIVLVKRGGTVILIRPVTEMAADLNDIPPRDGRLGLYWWLNADGTPNEPYRTGPAELPDIPY